MDDEVLREQIAYYRARAEEYDATSYGVLQGDANSGGDQPTHPELRAVEAALERIGPVDAILELAGGTGIWTRVLSQIGRAVTVLDASPEMLALNRQRVRAAQVAYQVADLFAWEPDRQYDLVFFAFWISHVPPAALDPFLDKIGRAVRPGGHVFIVDEPASSIDELATGSTDLYQTRALLDGREFTIVKVYYNPATLGEKLTASGFTRITGMTGDYFFYLSGTRE